MHFQALIIAHTEYPSIYQSTLGIMFFGTPHRGSDHASFFETISQIVNATHIGNCFTGKMRSDLLEALGNGSEPLVELIKAFRFHTDKMHFVTFYETRTTAPLSKPVGASSLPQRVMNGLQLMLVVDCYGILSNPWSQQRGDHSSQCGS